MVQSVYYMEVRMKKRYWRTIISLIATVVVLFALGGTTVFADENEQPQPEIVASGYCGAENMEESVCWTLDSTGLLTISGTGEMRDYEYGDSFFPHGIVSMSRLLR